MPQEPEPSNVLILTADPDDGERLARWTAAAGHRPLLPTGSERFMMASGDDETVDLLVTELDPGDPAARQFLDRLLRGELFPGTPRCHLLRDPALRDILDQRDPLLSSLAMLFPPTRGEFQEKIRLGSEIGRLRRELGRTAVRDPMTGLNNRAHVLQRLDEEFARARRHRVPLSVVIFDIDRLKVVNDTYGQVAGDTVIQRVSELLHRQVRKEDVLGRTGEESFTAILAGNRYRGAAIMANKVRNEVEELLLQNHQESFSVRVSAGVSSFPDNPSIQEADDLLRMAENALTQAKARGGNRVFIDEGVLRQERRVVMVADPNPALLDLAEDLLSMDDYQVVRVESSESLLETIRFRRPDLLVLDLQMLEDGSGAALLERIHEISPGSRFPIIGLSGEAGSDPEKLARSGVDRFLTKPFSLSLLRSLARELLESYLPA